MSNHADVVFCPSCGHADWPYNCPTSCVVGRRFHALVAERDEALRIAAAYPDRLIAAEAERDEAQKLYTLFRERYESKYIEWDASKTNAVKAAEARVTELEAALRRGCDEADYCYVCDCHPSHGHAKDCALAAPTKEDTDE